MFLCLTKISKNEKIRINFEHVQVYAVERYRGEDATAIAVNNPDQAIFYVKETPNQIDDALISRGVPWVKVSFFKNK